MMRGKLWVRFAPFLSKRYLSTCRTSFLSPSSSCSAIQPWLFVGLGNSSEKYQPTRHNIDSAMKEGVDILKMVVTKGLTEAARLSNVDQKYKHLISDDQQQ